jgi:hypothetical protein
MVMSARLQVPLFAILLLSSSVEARSASVSRPLPDLPRPAEECPALFGGNGVRAENAKRRGQLYWVDQEAGGVTIAHRSDDWDEPVRFEIRGIQLSSARGGSAVVELSPAGAAALGCRPGRYGVGVDQNLTRTARVLAVLDGVVLVERGRRLAYLLAAGARPPRWLVAWSAPGLIQVDGENGLGSDANESPYRRYPMRTRYGIIR